MRRGGSNYPWWLASHIRTRQSNWLEQNLQDMEEKVNITLKLIEQDGDSFAKRAEMYFRRRPELINFVEEFYRGYRALAERYDHISGELHSANSTIATVFPDKVKIPIDEDDVDSMKVPAKIDPSKFYKGSPENPQPKSLKNDAANPTSPKKVLERTTSSKMDRKTVEEMEKIQKNILVLQVEKELIKSSYEAGLAKFWEIENQIMELQGNACCLQEGIDLVSIVKEEDAETLMVTTTLKSCGKALAKLQEKQQRSEEETRIESNRIKDAEKKLRILKGEFVQYQTENQKLTNKATVAGSTIKNLEEVCDLNPERLELQNICQKIQEHFWLDSEKSLTVPELGEKTDGLVKKVSGLETAVLSQKAQIMRLRSEIDELQKHLQSLEDEKYSQNSTEKIRDLEEELQEAQALNRCIEDQKYQLQNNFSKAYHSLDVLAEKLQASEIPSLSQAGSLLNVETEKQLTDPKEINHAEESVPNFESHKESVDPEASAINFESEKKSTDPESSDQPEESVLDFGLQGMSTEPEETATNFELLKGNRDLKGRVPVSGSQKKSNDTEESEQSEESVLQLELQNISTDPGDHIPTFEFQNRSTDLEERILNVELPKHSPDPEQSVFNAELQKQNGDPENLESLHLLLLDHLEDREKILLSEYTTILRNYKETKRRLSDLEKQNQETYSATVAQIRDLKSSNAMKDEEIQSLRQKVNLLQLHSDEKPAEFIKSNGSASNGLDQIAAGLKLPLQTETHQPDSEVISKLPIFEPFEDQNLKFKGRTEESNAGTIVSAPPNEEEIKVVLIDGEDTVSTIEEKFRRDIDELLEENLEFWLRFSSSFHQIQKFQTTLQDLQAEFLKLKTENKKQEISSSDQSEKSEALPINKNLRELQNELSTWSEQNALLKEELQYRFSSLCSIQEEISTVLKMASEKGEMEFTAYQAGKFQGEVLSMQQENNKVEDELQAGLDHVKGLQSEVEKTLQKLHENFEISESKHHHKTRIPLRSFIFGAKPKKPSIFSCMNPALQKQYSDLRARIPM